MTRNLYKAASVQSPFTILGRQRKGFPGARYLARHAILASSEFR